MTINFTPATAQRLRSRAEARGVRPERYVEEVLERDLAGEAPDIAGDAISERLAQMDRAVARAGELWKDREYPPIPEGAFSSESLYEEIE